MLTAFIPSKQSIMQKLQFVFVLFILSVLSFTSCTEKDNNVLTENVTEEEMITDMESLMAYMKKYPPVLQDINDSNQEGYFPGVAPEAIKTIKYDLNGDGQLTEMVAEIKKGKVVIGGDIVLGTEQEVAKRQQKASARGVATSKNHKKWEGGFIPIVVGPYIQNDPVLMDKLLTAMRELGNKTDLSFNFRKGEIDYVYIKRSWGDEGNYSSSVGKAGDRQIISLTDNVRIGTVIHELLHAAGIYHEQTRCNRDEHISVFWDNLITTDNEKKNRNIRYQFQKQCDDGQDFGEYDFKSVMHYHPLTFSKDEDNDKYTILPITHKIWIFDDIVRYYKELGQMGQRDGLSDGDIATVNELYDITSVVTFGKLSGGFFPLGSLVQFGTSNDWVEKKADGSIHARFKEERRKEGIIFLRDESRKVNLYLDLNPSRKVVHYNDDSGKSFDLYSIISHN